uniref:Soluble immunoglobulin molecule homologue, IG_BOTSC n=1 Tax=Botryllus schlosseri TaxID=30301 RepID=P90724_BOTSH|nr:soluble immunoglobulin molecule homologue, IG_BOTSC [Botryllus schlosseri]
MAKLRETVFILCLSLGIGCVIASTSYEVKAEEADCVGDKTCRRFPEGCATDGDCSIVTWRPVTTNTTETKIAIELRSSTEAGYIALGFGRFSQMKDADVYYCTSGGVFGTAAMKAMHAPPDAMPLENGMVLNKISQVNARINCQFERRMSVTKPDSVNEYDYDISKETFHILVADGPFQDALQYHDWREVTDTKVNFTSKFGTQPASTTSTAGLSVSQSTVTAGSQTNSPVTTKSMPETTSSAMSSIPEIRALCSLLLPTVSLFWMR